jgi:hypothetical protein
LTLHNCWCLSFKSTTRLGNDWAKAINWVTQRINDATQEAITDWNRKDLASALYALTFGDLGTISKKNCTDFANVKVQS